MTISIGSDSSENTIVKKMSTSKKNDHGSHLPVKKEGYGTKSDGSQPVSKKKRWKWRKNKKRKSQSNQNSSENCESAKNTQTSHPVKRKLSENSDSLQPAKKRRKRKKKIKVSVEGTMTKETEYKPVLFIRKPEDYSANWKQLKEIITEGDKKLKEVKSVSTKAREIKEHKGKASANNKDVKKHKKKKKRDSPIKDQEKQKEKLEIWFDNVDPILLDEAEGSTETENMKGPANDMVTEDSRSNETGHTASLVKTKSYAGVTKVIAMDCEMVGTGINGKDSILARVSIVNHFGNTLYDKFVKPTEEVTDYRTKVSGIRPSDLETGVEFSIVQKEVSDLLNGRILVGHALRNDLRALLLCHPRLHIRDTSRFKKFRRMFGGRTPSLKKLTEMILSVKIQHGEHSSVQDAQAAMRLYTMNRAPWENLFAKKKRKLTARTKTKTEKTVTQTESTSGQDFL